MNLEIPQGDFAGYIFDCDGTLADTMPVHFKAWNESLKSLHAPFEFPEDLFYQLGGVASEKIVALLNERYQSNLDPETVAHRKEALFLELLDEVHPIGPVVALARRFASTHPVAVVSGGYRRVVVRTLELIGLAGLFPTIITPADVLHGKPAPDMFLLAALKMGVPPEKCLVFEDGQVGIDGAAKAGMATVFIPSRGLSFAAQP